MNFTLLLEEVSGREVVARLFSRLLLELEQPLLFNGVLESLPVRCGVAVSVPPHPSVTRLLMQTDVAYHRALVAPDRELSQMGSTYVLFDRSRHGAELTSREQASGQDFGTLRKTGLTADSPPDLSLILFPALCKVSGCSGLLAELPPSPVPAG